MKAVTACITLLSGNPRTLVLRAFFGAFRLFILLHPLASSVVRLTGRKSRLAKREFFLRTGGYIFHYPSDVAKCGRAEPGARTVVELGAWLNHSHSQG